MKSPSTSGSGYEAEGERHGTSAWHSTSKRGRVVAGIASVPETLWLELAPGETRLAVLVDSVRTPDGGLVWRGRFLEEDPEYRSIVLSLHDGLVRGIFEAGAVGYSLRPAPGCGSELLTLSARRGVSAAASGSKATATLCTGCPPAPPTTAPPRPLQTVAQVPRDVVVHDVEGLAPATAYRFGVLALGEQANLGEPPHAGQPRRRPGLRPILDLLGRPLGRRLHPPRHRHRDGSRARADQPAADAQRGAATDLL